MSDDRYVAEQGTVYLTGVQALVRMVLDRVRLDRRTGADPAAFVSGYEGSPLAGFDLELARRSPLLDAHAVVHRPGVNEELAATSVMGSQLAAGLARGRRDGVLGLWYGKAPGLDRATDALRHANLAGTHPRGGAVALVGDDPSAKSSSVPCASEHALADLAIPVFSPADPQDVIDLGPHAVELSRASGLWTAMKVVTNVADAACTVRLDPGWTAPALTGAAAYRHRPSSRLLGPELAALEHSLHRTRLPLALEYLRASGVNRVVRSGPADRVGIIAAGKSYLDLRQALRMLGLDDAALARFGIRILKLGVIHPVEPVAVTEFAEGLDEIVVVEEKRALIEPAVKEILYGRGGAPRVQGKQGPDGRPLFSELGELDPDTVAAGLARRLAGHGEIGRILVRRPRKRRERIAVPLLSRTPYFCSGCPHNSSTKVPDGTLVGGGIGCHTMTLFMEPEQVGDVLGITQMGGEGAQWIGMAPFVGTRHLVQNIGDGTFTHSGSLAVRAAVAAGVNITFKLLHNSAVAMTGGQDVIGALPLDRCAALLLAEGVAKVVITSDQPRRLRRLRLPRGVTVRPREDLLRVQEELATVPGVTVLIHDQECAAEKRRKRRRGARDTPATKVVVNERVCEGCGDCGVKSNCLSVRPVDTEFGRKTRIHQGSCNADYSCLDGDCPSFLTVVPDPGHRRTEPAPLAATAVPEPGVPARDVAVRITGIGGTGVVTVAQVLATAAVLEGRQVRTLDQTGLAQKGGAVVSDVKITTEPVEQAAKLAAGECDLYLACDALVATDPVPLAAADPDRTVAVVSTAEVPTGRMIVDTAVSFPDQSAIRSVLDGATARARYLDARGLAEALFGDDQFAQILLLGVACQSGELPVAPASVERAIEINGTAVPANIQAFRRGRQLVADPDALAAALSPVADAPAPAAGPAKTTEATEATEAAELSVRRVRALVRATDGTELARQLDVRVPDLIAYQNEKYARTYAETVERVRARFGDGPITRAVATNLYKLMAYKDEYEVARLSLDPALRAGIEARFGPGARYAHQLHPPVLRALGVRRKIAFGPGSRPVLRLLRAARRLRGTPLDPFGYARMRRIERALVAEYTATVTRVLEAPQPDEAVVLDLLGLPDLVRGYEDVKLGNVERYRQRRAELLAELDRAATGCRPAGTP
ncbi:indolepyruvate ferredoxin oxidoreductase family protein [Prauserella shujinwangii]|uniref:indolepyruvate ferredoxin oxidoreductase family protein n=1 Tax=Prauserella shujinwangii TaxID=1453103 RepID=UPI003CCBB38D